jgi:hypothetical protein
VIQNGFKFTNFDRIHLQELFPLKKYVPEPIISSEHFVDIVFFMRNNNKTGVGFNREEKTCRQKNNGVKNSSSPGGTWLSSF